MPSKRKRVDPLDGSPAEVVPTPASLPDVALDAEAELEGIRLRLRENGDKCRRIAIQPIPRTDTERRLDDWIATGAARFTPTWSVFWQADPTNAALFQLLGLSRIPHGADSDEVVRRFEAYECWRDPDGLRRRMLADIEAAWPAGAEELDAAERARRLEELAIEREALEILEEACIRRAERAGTLLDRRASAHPAVVLGDEADLEDVA